jgi:hypothetical protein
MCTVVPLAMEQCSTEATHRITAQLTRQTNCEQLCNLAFLSTIALYSISCIHFVTFCEFHKKYISVFCVARSAWPVTPPRILILQL